MAQPNLAHGDQPPGAQPPSALPSHATLRQEETLPQGSLGWIGFGSMGREMAGRLLDAGFSLSGYNRDAGKIPHHPRLLIRNTPGEVAGNARILFIMVTDGHASRAILSGDGGILSALSPGSIVVNMSTISPGDAISENRLVEESGSHYLDIPVSGSVIPARKGELLLLAGGETQILERLSPLLSILGKETLHLGPPGSGMTGKLFINALLAAQMKVLSQTVALGESLGFHRDRVLDLILKSPLANPFYHLKRENLSSRTYPKAFSLALMEKDLTLAEEECIRRHIDTSFIRELIPPYRESLEAGLGESDLSVIFERYRKSAS